MNLVIKYSKSHNLDFISCLASIFNTAHTNGPLSTYKLLSYLFSLSFFNYSSNLFRIFCSHYIHSFSWCPSLIISDFLGHCFKNNFPLIQNLSLFCPFVSQLERISDPGRMQLSVLAISKPEQPGTAKGSHTTGGVDM